MIGETDARTGLGTWVDWQTANAGTLWRLSEKRDIARPDHKARIVVPRLLDSEGRHIGVVVVEPNGVFRVLQPWEARLEGGGSDAG